MSLNDHIISSLAAIGALALAIFALFLINELKCLVGAFFERRQDKYRAQYFEDLRAEVDEAAEKGKIAPELEIPLYHLLLMIESRDSPEYTVETFYSSIEASRKQAARDKGDT
jgi:hypothetical protein